MRFFRQNLQTLLALKKFRHGKDRSFHTAVFLTPFTLLIISQKSLQKVCTFGVDKNLPSSFPYTRQSLRNTRFAQKEMKPQPFVPGVFPSFIIFQTGFQTNFSILIRGSSRGVRGERVSMVLTPNKQHVREKRKSAPWHFLWRFREKMRCLLVQNHSSGRFDACGGSRPQTSPFSSCQTGKSDLSKTGFPVGFCFAARYFFTCPGTVFHRVFPEIPPKAALKTAFLSR